MKLQASTRLPFVLAAPLLLFAACSRELPSAWPENSPASVAAEPLAPASVTLALDAEPPLPGEAAEGWIGLDRPSTAPASGAHQHHGHHKAPSPKPEHGHDH